MAILGGQGSTGQGNGEQLEGGKGIQVNELVGKKVAQSNKWKERRPRPGSSSDLRDKRWERGEPTEVKEKSHPARFSHLNPRDGEIGDLKLDPNGGPALLFFLLHTGEAKVGAHQVLLAPLKAHGDIKHTEGLL